MSIQPVKRNGKVVGHKVRWYVGGRHHGRTFTLKKDAEAFELEMKRRRQLGILAQQQLVSNMTLTEFALSEWFPNYAFPNLKEDTYRRYAEVWANDLFPRVGAYKLIEITPAVVQDLSVQLARPVQKTKKLKDGTTKTYQFTLSPASQRKALLLLQGILRRAAVRGLIAANPVQQVDKPRVRLRSREPLSPEVVERIRARMRPRDATLVSVLAYAGLRPGEATTARWGDIRGDQWHVLASKTDRERWIDILSPLKQDLLEWRMASGNPGDGELIFARTQERSKTRKGAEWTLSDWQNWRRRIYQPAAKAAGVTGDMRPYRLRGSFASLLLWAGEDIAYVAEQDGHSIATLGKHYAGVLRDLRGQERVPAAEAIRRARANLVCPVSAPASGQK